MLLFLMEKMIIPILLPMTRMLVVLNLLQLKLLSLSLMHLLLFLFIILLSVFIHMTLRVKITLSVPSVIGNNIILILMMQTMVVPLNLNLNITLPVFMVQITLMDLVSVRLLPTLSMTKKLVNYTRNTFKFLLKHYTVIQFINPFKRYNRFCIII